MDGFTQLSESVYEWWTSQQKLLNECQTVPIPTGDMGLPMWSMYSGTLRMWERSVDECLAAQAALSQQMRDMVNHQELLPEEVKGAIFQMQDINDKWREGREKLWHDWFNLMKKVGSEARDIDIDAEEDEGSGGGELTAKAESKPSEGQAADTEAGKSKAKASAKTASEGVEGGKKKQALQA